MERADTKSNPLPQRALAPANCNHGPISWRLEDGLTAPLVGALAELLSCAASYAPTKEDRRDLQGASALAFDVANRLRKRGAPRLVGSVANV